MNGFKSWLLKEDIFGFEKERIKASPSVQVDESPIISINTEVMWETIMKVKINNNEPFSRFLGEVQWGNEIGAVKMIISPLGSFKSTIKKLSTDLEGNRVWITKRIIPFVENQHTTVAFDTSLAEETLGKILEVSKEETELPKREYKELEVLTKKLSSFCNRKDVLPPILIYRGIKEMRKDENYLIYFECRGQGLEAPDSGRLEQFIIEMNYDKKTGLIRSFGYEVMSETKQHKWIPQPSEWNEYFLSNQSVPEIVNCVGQAFQAYG